MLWDLSLWHSLVKLRLHSESTVFLLDAAASELGQSVRCFSRATDHIKTYEVPKEDAAKGKKRRKRQVKEGQAPPKQTKLNLKTYKWHNITHYSQDVDEAGPTDAYDTRCMRNLTDVFTFLIS